MGMVEITDTNVSPVQNAPPVYFGTGEPTVAREVSADTPLDELNLNWKEKELREHERTKHVNRLHPYLGKYIPQLVEIFLRKYFAPGNTVLDPFCGSGTTLVQANELGINSVGYDVSAFNILLADAKTHQYDIKRVGSEILEILSKVAEATKSDNGQLPLGASTGKHTETTEQNEFLTAWYAPQALRELLTYRDLISNYEYQIVLSIILSRAARSARQTTHFDLDFPKKPQTEPYWCYKHSRECKPVAEAFKLLRRYSRDTIRRLDEFSKLRTDAGVDIRHEDSRTATIPYVDGVVTSPPYVGLIDYHEQHRYAYELLGIEDRRDLEIGPAQQGTSKAAKQAYIDAIAAVFRNACASMPQGGRLIVVAGDRHGLYGEIAERSGVEVEAILQRHVNRRTGRRSGDFYESVFVWRKP